MTNQSRRKFLKSMSYSPALALGGLTSAAFAFSDKTEVAQTSSDISIMQQQSHGKEIVTLVNNSNKTITLDSIHPVKLERVNGSLVVKVNALPTDGTVAMLPNERLSFDILDTNEAVHTNHLTINSEHIAFNGEVPVTFV